MAKMHSSPSVKTAAHSGKSERLLRREVELHKTLKDLNFRHLRDADSDTLSNATNHMAHSDRFRLILSTTHAVNTPDGYTFINELMQDHRMQGFIKDFSEALMKSNSPAKAISDAQRRTGKPQNYQNHLKQIKKLVRAQKNLEKKTMRSGREFFAPKITYARAERKFKKLINELGEKEVFKELNEILVQNKIIEIQSIIIEETRKRLKEGHPVRLITERIKSLPKYIQNELNKTKKIKKVQETITYSKENSEPNGAKEPTNAEDVGKGIEASDLDTGEEEKIEDGDVSLPLFLRKFMRHIPKGRTGGKRQNKK